MFEDEIGSGSQIPSVLEISILLRLLLFLTVELNSCQYNYFIIDLLLPAFASLHIILKQK